MYQQITANRRKTALLIFFFFLFLLLIGWLIGRFSGYGYEGIIIAFIVSLLMTLLSYYQGDRIALWTAGAKPIEKKDNPYVYRLVENLCITAGLPLPKIYIIPDQAINAFATGRDPKHASLALTDGAIKNLANEELEAVIAHELSHIKNYDIRLMMLVAVLIGTIVLLTHWFWRIRWSGSRDSERNQLGTILFIIGLVLIILSPIIAQLIQLAISRRREFLADADGALLTRYPEGLALALEKIAACPNPLKNANNATAHLYISNPFGGKTLKGLAKMFSTHPPIEERIKTLRSMAI